LTSSRAGWSASRLNGLGTERFTMTSITPKNHVEG
jgi:hypothetical protein